MQNSPQNLHPGALVPHRTCVGKVLKDDWTYIEAYYALTAQRFLSGPKNKKKSKFEVKLGEIRNAKAMYHLPWAPWLFTKKLGQKAEICQEHFSVNSVFGEKSGCPFPGTWTEIVPLEVKPCSTGN